MSHRRLFSLLVSMLAPSCKSSRDPGGVNIGKGTVWLLSREYIQFKSRTLCPSRGSAADQQCGLSKQVRKYSLIWRSGRSNYDIYASLCHPPLARTHQGATGPLLQDQVTWGVVSFLQGWLSSALPWILHWRIGLHRFPFGIWRVSLKSRSK